MRQNSCLCCMNNRPLPPSALLLLLSPAADVAHSHSVLSSAWLSLSLSSRPLLSLSVSIAKIFLLTRRIFPALHLTTINMSASSFRGSLIIFFSTRTLSFVFVALTLRLILSRENSSPSSFLGSTSLIFSAQELLNASSVFSPKTPWLFFHRLGLIVYHRSSVNWYSLLPSPFYIRFCLMSLLISSLSPGSLNPLLHFSRTFVIKFLKMVWSLTSATSPPISITIGSRKLKSQPNIVIASKPISLVSTPRSLTFITTGPIG